MAMYTYLTLALVAVARAGTLHGCAGSCIGQAIAETGCASSDSLCICSSDVFMETVEGCVPEKCATEEQAPAISFAQDFCNSISSTELKRDADLEPRKLDWETHLTHKDEKYHHEKERLHHEVEHLQRIHDRLKKDSLDHPNNERLQKELERVHNELAHVFEAREKLHHEYRKLHVKEKQHGVTPPSYPSPPEGGQHPPHPPSHPSPPEGGPHPHPYPPHPTPRPSPPPSPHHPEHHKPAPPPWWWHHHHPHHKHHPTHVQSPPPYPSATVF